MIRNRNILWVDEGNNIKNRGKTYASCATRMMQFSLRFWSGYLHQPKKYYNDSLALSLPIFWQFCSLSATFISTARGMMESEACKFSKMLFLYLFFQLRLINILNLRYQNGEYFEYYVISVNKGT